MKRWDAARTTSTSTRFGARYAYTLDGSKRGDLEIENFSADALTITFHGFNAHPGYAKGRMVNAIKIAAEFVHRLPRHGLSPETTEGYEGFVHPHQIQGGVERAAVRLLLRDFTTKGLDDKARMLADLAAEVVRPFPSASVQIDRRESYRNMKEVLDRHPEVVDHAKTAMRRAGLTPHIRQIRGGTDGARLSFMGLPTPNLFAGEHNIHSRLEWTSVQDMDKAVEVIVEICRSWAGGYGTRFCNGCRALSTRDWLAQSFRYAIEKWFPSDLAGRETAEWSRDRLVSLLKERLAGVRVVVVANREPYIHNEAGAKQKWIRPASGLVTALDPIMRATGGVWVAHGSGSGDRETADEHGRLAVPPDKPSYTLASHLADQRRRRRLLLRVRQPGVVAPLSHRVYTARVRRVGLGAVCSGEREVRRGRARRDRGFSRDRSRSGLSFRPAAATRQEPPPRCDHQSLLAHSLAASRKRSASAHGRPRFSTACWGAICSGFTCSCTATISSRRSIACSRRGLITSDSRSPAVHTKPRCAPFRSASTWKASRRTATRAATSRPSARAWACATSGRSRVGVDRMDYTKGIPERLRAVDRFLERYPVWRERFVFLQLGAPSRTEIREYRALNDEIDDLTAHINAKYGVGDWNPIRLALAHHGIAGHLRRLSRGERLRRVVAARRHEPCRERVRCRARRPAGRADSVAVHRRGPRDARRAPRQSLCDRCLRRRAERRAHDAASKSSSGACSVSARRWPNTISFVGPACCSRRRFSSRSRRSDRFVPQACPPNSYHA